jgi:hypothetical protein
MWAEAVDEAGEITDLARAKAAAEFAEPAMRFTSPTLSAIDANMHFDLTALNDEELDALERKYRPRRPDGPAAPASLGRLRIFESGVRRFQALRVKRGMFWSLRTPTFTVGISRPSAKFWKRSPSTSFWRSVWITGF